MQKKKVSILALLWLILLVLTTPFLLLSFCNNIHPFFDSLSDIRNWLAGLLILAALPLLFFGLRRAPLMLILFAFLIIGMTWQTGGVRPFMPPTKPEKPYTLLQSNLRFDNKNHEKLLMLIEKEKPDFITYQEGARQWQPVLEKLKTDYPYRVDCPRSTGIIGSTGILSRIPFVDKTAFQCPLNGAIAMGTFHADNRDITVISVHLHWPWPHQQHEQLDALQKALQLPQNTTRLVAGDFNAVTWSNAVKRMQTLTQTRHVATIGPTWLSYKIPSFFRPYFGLPIDQVLVSSDIGVLSVERATSIGSDHLPVKMQFTLP